MSTTYNTQLSYDDNVTTHEALPLNEREKNWKEKREQHIEEYANIVNNNPNLSQESKNILINRLELALSAKSIIDNRIEQIEQAIEDSRQRSLELDILLFNYEQKSNN